MPLHQVRKDSIKSIVRKQRHWPVALSIGGSDSGAGAGIQADIKTFTAFKVHGTSVISGVTAQNPLRITDVQLTSSRLFRKQLEAVFGAFSVAAVKTGMMGSTRLMNELCDFFEQTKPPALVVDPVRFATSGSALLTGSGLKRARQRLFGVAALLTPNIAEGEDLLNTPIRTPAQLRNAARVLSDQFRCAVLMKGGHLPGSDSVDFFFDGKVELLLAAPRVKGVKTHGTGCVYSAAITACLALGHPLPEAVERAKHYVSGAIANHLKVGDFSVLNPLP
jgi:hydroxymethylpyrimidine/phosphomethylpyrimidine kinase